ncbi:MJ0042-type zinc finger domain-containing protein [Geoglobus ahangari]
MRRRQRRRERTNITCPECGAKYFELNITHDYKVHCTKCNHSFYLYRVRA